MVWITRNDPCLYRAPSRGLRPSPFPLIRPSATFSPKLRVGEKEPVCAGTPEMRVQFLLPHSAALGEKVAEGRMRGQLAG
jgi:hypothetical protein